MSAGRAASSTSRPTGGEFIHLARVWNGRGVTVAITDAYAAPTIYEDAENQPN